MRFSGKACLPAALRRSTTGGKCCRNGQQSQDSTQNSPVPFGIHVQSPRPRVKTLKSSGDCVSIGEKRNDGGATKHTRLGEPATPLSHVPIGLKTGGFASPPCGGFALTLRSQLTRSGNGSALTHVTKQTHRRVMSSQLFKRILESRIGQSVRVRSVLTRRR